MAYSLCSSPSSLLHRHLSLPNSSGKPKSSSFPEPLRLNFLSSQFRASVQISNVSLQDSIFEETQMQNLAEDENFQGPFRKNSKSSQFSTWVNPRSSKAPSFRKASYGSRYSSLLSVAKSLDKCSSNSEEILGVLNNFGDNIFEQDAVVILNNMSNPDAALLVLNYFVERLKPEREVVFYNVTMKVFKKSRDFGSAEKLFDEMLERGVKPDRVTFLTLISCARACALPEKAIEWYEKMPSLGCDPDGGISAVMVDAYGQAGRVDIAFDLYDQARTEKCRIDTSAFASLIKAYGIAGNFDGCLNLYEEMKALGAKPNLLVYNIMLDAMGRAKRPWQAKSIYKDMTDNGIAPSWGTYAALLRAFGKARYSQDALRVYEEMKEKGMELNVNLYNTLLSLCADLGYADEAAEIFNDMKKSGTDPDSWTFSSMITLYSCSGRVSEAESILNQMMEAGIQPTIFVLTSLIQCYGKVQQTDNVVRTFNQLLELGIVPDNQFIGCLLSAMTQTPKEELHKLTACVETANPKLGRVVKLLVEEHDCETDIKMEVSKVFEPLVFDEQRVYLNCLIDLCINLNLLERACVLLELGISEGIYAKIQSKTPMQTSLNLRGLSHGAALTALHVWINDLSKEIRSGEELPPLLGINTGHGKHKYADKGLAYAFQSHLEELRAPFHEAPDKPGWFLTTNFAFKSWLVSRNSPDSADA